MGILDILYPPRCPVCHEVVRGKGKLCLSCKKKLPYIKEPKCKKCGKTQALTVQMVNRYLDSTGGRCPRCGRDMFAVNGQFGVYVRCSENHISKLDEI